MKTKKPRAKNSKTNTTTNPDNPPTNSKPNNSQTNQKPKNPRKKPKNPPTKTKNPPTKTKNPPTKTPPTKTKKSAKKGQVKTTKKSKAIKKSIEKDPPQKTKKEEIIFLPSKFPKRPKKPVPIKKHMTRRSFLDNVNALEGASPQVSPEVRPAESKLDLFLERLT